MLLIAVFSQYFFGFTIFVTSLFLVMLVLVQRGRGGGLTGALGGAGGQSAFGTKAGDLFTRITIAIASIWIILCAAAVFFLKDRDLPDTGANNVDNVTIESSSNSSASITPASNASSVPATSEPAVTGPAATGPAIGDTPANSGPIGTAPPDAVPAADGSDDEKSPTAESAASKPSEAAAAPDSGSEDTSAAAPAE